jgi:acetyl esterase/lipase
MKPVYILLMVAILATSCAARKIEDIQYAPSETETVDRAALLNVFTPRQVPTKKLPVVIFIHGGYWEEGNKDIYGFLGRNFAKHDVVTVIPNYTLSPKGNYDTMATDVVKAIQWTQAHIADYGGDAEQLYLMGHSAGGHLIALVTTNPQYPITNGAIKGVILNDAAGLDMKTYLERYPPTTDHHFDVTWTTNPEMWKKASPVYFVDADTPPYLIYVGEKTYPAIKTENQSFLEALQPYQSGVRIHYLNKKHVPMMRHYFFPWVNRYDEILAFMHQSATTGQRATN